MAKLSDDHLMALARVVKDCAERHGEDIIGVLIKNGARTLLNENDLISLAGMLAEYFERSEKETLRRIKGMA